MIKSVRSRRTVAAAAAGGLAVLALSLGMSAPANALGATHPKCGNGDYYAASTTTYAQSEQYNSYVCGNYYARATFQYDGTTQYDGYIKNSTDAVAKPGYNTVTKGSHYTDDSAVIST